MDHQTWELSKAEWPEDRRKRNDAVEQSKQGYFERHPESIEEYRKMVLSGSNYPDIFASNASLEFVEDQPVAVFRCIPPYTMSERQRGDSEEVSQPENRDQRGSWG